MSYQFGKISRQRVAVTMPLAQHRYFVHSLNKGDKLSLPEGCVLTGEPERLPDELFHRIEYMPVRFRKLPFAFTVEHEKKEQIEKILHQSLKQQKHEDVSYCPGFVCCVVKNCLTAIDVPCSLEIGYRKIERDSRPHVWLNVCGVKIDNAYERFLTKHQISCLEKATPNCYQESFLNSQKKGKIPSDKDGFSLVCYEKNVKIFQDKPDKGLALGHNHEQLYVYFFNMIRFMSESFNVDIKGINPAVRHFCWGCGKFPPKQKNLLTCIPDNYEEVDTTIPGTLKKFQYCSYCTVARYCSVQCQENDWENQHRFVCVSRVPGPCTD